MADQGIKDFVNALYTTQLGREADTAGLEAWSNAIASGMSQEAVANAIANSAEARVAQIYQQEVGRGLKGDAAAQNWVQAIESGNLTADQVRQQVARSQEGAQYDVARMYTGKDGLQRQGTLADVYAKDPAAKQWEQALMSGAITEQQFRDAVLGSAEYKGLTGGTTTPDTTKTPATNWELKLKEQQDAFAKQMADAQANFQRQLDEQAQLRAQQQRTLQQSMQGNLMESAVRNAAAGQFTPTAPLTMAPTAPAQTPMVGGLPSAAPVAAAPTVAAPVAAAPEIAPAPTMYVPQTYLAPAPPQYRGISPFQVPFQGPTANPFESYFSIATRRRPGAGMPQYLTTGTQQGQAPAAMGPPPAYSFYSPFSYYSPFAPAPSGPPAPVAAPTTTPTT